MTAIKSYEQYLEEASAPQPPSYGERMTCPVHHKVPLTVLSQVRVVQHDAAMQVNFLRDLAKLHGDEVIQDVIKTAIDQVSTASMWVTKAMVMASRPVTADLGKDSSEVTDS